MAFEFNSYGLINFLFFLFLCLNILGQVTISQAQSSQQNHHHEQQEPPSRQVVWSQFYDKRVIPRSEDNQPIDVTVQINFVALGPINKKRFTVDTDFLLYISWKDSRLRLANASSSGARLNIKPSDSLWIPDLFFLNARNTKTHSLLTPSSFLDILPDSSIHVSVRVTATYSCFMDLRPYPFDTQQCMIQIESYSYGESRLKLKWAENESIIANAGVLHVSAYEVVHVSTEKTVVKYMQEDYSRLTMHICLRRQANYYYYHIFVPTILLVILSWGTFWLPPQAVPARVSLIITTFLAVVFIMQGASKEITKVGYITALEVFECASFLFIVAAMMEYLVALNQNKEQQDQPRQKKIESQAMLTPSESLINANNGQRPEVISLRGNQELGKLEKFKRKLMRCDPDFISSIVFPILYLIFCTIYGVYFTNLAAEISSNCIHNIFT